MSDAPHAAARPEPAQSAPTVAFGEALRFWLKLGFISFGGPAGQIAIMHSELVQRRRWISERRFLHALNYCMVLPGPEAQQLATYIGWLVHRTWGGIVAGGLFVLPSLFILIGLSWLYMAHGTLGWVQGLFWGIKPAVVAVIAFAGWRLGSKVLRGPLAWALALASFVALLAGVAFPWVIAAAALVGVLTARHWKPAAHAAAEGSSAPDATPHVIDDHTPPPPHARFSARRLALLLAVGAALWVLPMAVLTALYGWQGALTQMGWFFTKVALLTFGGAYAVLPYVYQGAVDHYGWLTATQMIDGLALGETTPGPLIMVVAFVGYVGGWGAAEGLALAPWAAGALAAGVVTFFTFLPSFLFILIGGPLVESGRQHSRLAAPLAAVSAAVVGGIAKLAVFFAGAVLWAPALDARLAAAWAIAVAAALALFVFKRGVLEVIGAAAVLGVALNAVLG
jgi:chromate transporter